MSSDDDTHRDSKDGSTETTGTPLLEIADDGTLRGQVPPEIREKFHDGELFSPVYDGGRIVLQGVR